MGGEGNQCPPPEPYDLSNASYTDTSVSGRSVSISISGIVVNDTSNVSKITVVCGVRDVVGTPTVSKDLPLATATFYICTLIYTP